MIWTIWPDLIKNQWITKLDFDSRESVDSALRLIRGERQEKKRPYLIFMEKVMLLLVY